MTNFGKKISDLFKLYDDMRSNEKEIHSKEFKEARAKFNVQLFALDDYVSKLEIGKEVFDMVCHIVDKAGFRKIKDIENDNMG